MGNCKGEIILSAKPGEVGMNICDQHGKVYEICFAEEVESAKRAVAENLRAYGYEVKC